MLIDWFTVAAQALNFLVLVWLMKRFLYKPVLDAIASRERLIAGELADAAAMKVEAKREREDFEHKNDTFDHQRSERTAQATDEVKVERKRLLDEARSAADVLAAKQQKKLRSELRQLHEAIARRTRHEVFSIARKALADLASARLETSMSELFARRLGALDGPAKDLLATALETSREPAIVRSAFDLAPDERESTQRAIAKLASAQIEVRFETAPEVISGIELTAGGQKVSWSIAAYLASLEQAVDELVDSGDADGVANEAKPDVPVAPASASGPARISETRHLEPGHP